MIARTFDLWTEGLAEALLMLKSYIWRPRRFQLRSEGRQLILSLSGVSPPRHMAVMDADAPVEVSPETLRETRGGLIEIIVPSAAIVERDLGILPAESRSFLDQVVRHQIEALLPWRTADMLYTTKAETLGDGRLNVSVRATTRSAIKAALTAAEMYRAGEISIVGENDQSTKILASISAERQADTIRARLISRYALAGVMTAFVVIIGWTTFATWSLTADVAALDKAIATRRAVIARRATANESAGSNWLEARRKELPLAVSILDDLSQILPADTYLTEFSFEAGRVRFTGVSANAASLVPLLEGSQRFKNASFFTPTTRLTGNAGDRFSIEATTLTGSEGTK
jgi:general secretion pathway protein L